MKTGLLLLLVVFMIAPGVRAQTMTLYPVELVSVAGETDGLPDARVLMRFNLAAVPQGAIIQYAGLRLTDGNDVAWKSLFVPVVAAALTTDWDTSASWDGPSAGESWQSPGGDYDDRNTAYRVLVTKARAPATFWVTEIVTAWLNGDVPNHGLVAMVEEGADLADVAPHFNAETLKPTLEIRYFLPQETRR